MPASGASSVEKALDVLMCFSPEEPELGVSQIARRLGIGVSTAHRLLQLMMRKDFVRRNAATARYSLGFRVVHLASTVVARSAVRAASLPHMLSVRDATGETVRLYLLSGREQVCIEEVESGHALRAPRRLGRAEPLHAGAAGRALLAHLPDYDVQQIVGDGRGAGALSAGAAAGLIVALDQVRLEGLALAEEVQEGERVRSLAVPLRNFTGAVVGVLAVDGPTTRWSESRARSFAPDVVEHGRVISRALGYAGPTPGQGQVRAERAQAPRAARTRHQTAVQARRTTTDRRASPAVHAVD